MLMGWHKTKGIAESLTTPWTAVKFALKLQRRAEFEVYEESEGIEKASSAKGGNQTGRESRITRIEQKTSEVTA